MGRRAKPPKKNAEAKRPLAGKPPKDGGAKVRDLEKRLAEALKRESEALEQQTATAEILRVISSSPTGVQPVFEAIARSATTLCEADLSGLYPFDGDLIHFGAQHGRTTEEIDAARRAFPQPPSRLSVVARSILAAAVVQVADVGEDPEVADALRMFKTVLSVPMLREGRPLGAIMVARRAVRPFSDKQIALLKTFADQAVIAIENVRLFNETKEALEQQTATSEILRVISSSPTNLQPVLDAVVESATRFCGAHDAELYKLHGTDLTVAAHHGPISAPMGRLIPVVRGTVAGRAVLERRAVHVADLHAEPEEFPVGYALAREFEFRTVVSVPLLREGKPVGTINLRRTDVSPFTDASIALLQTFADQAVIAIENVRLFTELQSSNRELRAALDQQTATAEILRVISGSPTAVEPVFQAIVQSGLRLLGGYSAILLLVRDDQFHLAAFTSTGPQGDTSIARLFPVLVAAEPLLERTVRERRPVVVEDVETEPGFTDTMRQMIRARGWRSSLQMPMVRDSDVVGLVAVTRRKPGRFAADEMALLETFAAQAVIAIENAHLFTELQASNRDLTTALDTQTVTSDILRVISRSQTDVQPVFDAIVQSAVRLLRAYTGMLVRIAGDQLHLVALTSTDAAGDAAVRGLYPRSLHSEGAHPQAIRDLAPVNFSDVPTDPRLTDAQHTIARDLGFRSQVAVPLVRHNEAVGAISVTRREPGGFADDEIALLQTFADQAVIAIENARLLSELQARTQDLTRSVEQLTALGDVGRAVSSSLDLDTVLTTIVGRAVQLSGTDGGTIFEYDEGAEEFSPRATLNANESQSALLRATRLRRGEGAVGQMAVTREPLQIPDIAAEGAYDSRLRGALLEAGTRAVLAIPLLHEERIIGGLVVTRRTPGAFTTEIVEILRTFAAQSALAIQNARLFHEIERKSRELEVASQHKSEFLANMSHELRTPLNAIIGFSEVLTARMFGELNEKQDEYLKDIYASGQHLLSLINDILDLSKIEAGRMELELADFHLPSAVEDALILVRERASRRGIALGHTIDSGLGMVRADERKVKQVLLNLLSNALKFTPEGGRVDVRAGLRDDLAEISVADTGVGIAPEDQEAVFEEFRQVGTAAKKVEGTGLGLALSRKFVELHGGRIWVTSQVGEGSTFTFTLPVRREKEMGA